jgi:hypothetical protein
MVGLEPAAVVGERSIGVTPWFVLTVCAAVAVPESPPHPVRLPRARTVPATNIERKPKPALVITQPPHRAVKITKWGGEPRVGHEPNVGCRRSASIAVYEIARLGAIPATPLS